jgi:hypothetical protein
MHIDGNTFLGAVVESLELIIQAHVHNETVNQLGLGLQGHICLLWLRCVQPTTLHVGFHPLLGQFPVIYQDIGGAINK